MIFESFFDAWFFLMASIFGLSLILGYTAGKTNFCTLGAISDWVNFEDKSRMRAWVLAMGIAILSVGFLEYYQFVDLAESFPNYRRSNIVWAENILGGLLFGVGMTYASGCGNKTLVRVGEGDINSLLTLITMSIAAYYMYNPFPNSENTIFSTVFMSWLSPLALEIATPQDISSIIYKVFPVLSVINISVFKLFLSSIVALLLLYWVFKGKTHTEHKVSGTVVGLCVVAFWVISNNTFINYDDEKYKPHVFMSEWEMVYEVPEEKEDIDNVNDLKPKNAQTFRPQSFSFVNPAGNTFGLIKEAGANLVKDVEEDEYQIELKMYLNMGVMAVLGVILGSFLSALTGKSFKVKFNRTGGSIAKSLLSGVIMGIGGVLAMGCTIGQGVSGVSTMAVGSFLVLFSIMVGSYATQKFIYWQLMRD